MIRVPVKMSHVQNVARRCFDFFPREALIPNLRQAGRQALWLETLPQCMHTSDVRGGPQPRQALRGDKGDSRVGAARSGCDLFLPDTSSQGGLGWAAHGGLT